MRIGFSSFVMDQGRSGIGTYIINLLKGLQDEDIRNQYDIFVDEVGGDLIPIKSSKFRILKYPVWMNNPLLNIPWHHLCLPFLEWKNGYDLVHIPTIRRIPLIKNCKMVATIHDMAPLIFPEKYGYLRHYYYSKILTYLVHRCDRIIAVSHNTKEDIMRFTGYPEEKIDVIYSGIDTTTYRPIEKKIAQEKLGEKYQIKTEFILYVSRLEHPGKNHVNLIKAFELFKKKNHTNHRLILVGADWNGAETIKRVTAESPVSNDILFLGFIQKEDVALLYNACDLMVFPSLYEGFGFPIIEAMACGAPVICSNNTSLGEIATGYAETFDPNNFEEICQSIEEGLRPSYKENVVNKCLTYASSFQWKETAKEVLRVYQSAMES